MAELSLSQEFGKLVRDKRMALKISQEEFAYRCGVHRTYMTHIERGSKMPSIEVVGKIARGLGVEISTLFIELEKRGVTVDRTTDAPTQKFA
ncbi:MAG: helix-turn-helix domain-containing protein [Armatimonadetes bacterium]|nr:helix-turn-helix domain-containing protein [Armatimonadota bacterium]